MALTVVDRMIYYNTLDRWEANSVDRDQRSILLRVCTICSGISLKDNHRNVFVNNNTPRNRVPLKLFRSVPQSIISPEIQEFLSRIDRPQHITVIRHNCSSLFRVKISCQRQGATEMFLLKVQNSVSLSVTV